MSLRRSSNTIKTVVVGLEVIFLCLCTLVACKERTNAHLQVHATNCGLEESTVSRARVVPDLKEPDDEDSERLGVREIKRLLDDVTPYTLYGRGYTHGDWVYLYKLAYRLQQEPSGDVRLACKEYVLHYQTGFREEDVRSAEERVFALLCIYFAVPDGKELASSQKLDQRRGYGYYSDTDEEQAFGSRYCPFVWENSKPRLARNTRWAGSATYDLDDTFEYLNLSVGLRAGLAERVDCITNSMHTGCP